MIEERRKRIDEIDEQLLKLLNERAECALAIGREKARQGLPIHSPEREEEVLARLEAQNRGPLSQAAVQRIFKAIFLESRRLEEQITVPERKKR